MYVCMYMIHGQPLTMSAPSGTRVPGSEQALYSLLARYSPPLLKPNKMVKKEMVRKPLHLLCFKESSQGQSHDTFVYLFLHVDINTKQKWTWEMSSLLIVSLGAKKSKQ